MKNVLFIKEEHTLMRKLITGVLFSVLLVGCGNPNFHSQEKNMNHQVGNYEGRILEIAVIGDQELPEINNVKYENIKLSALDHNVSTFDAIIITESAFSEADKEKYVPFFNTVKYPVFFFGTEGFMDFAFVSENTTMEMAANEESGYVQGFNGRNTEDSISWRFFLPDGLEKDEVKDKELLVKVFNVIDGLKES
ncbi:hypothetical protein [Exiguobacterium aurantiacum]|uniref:Lipoprotein n=2 Tax=Exiguobacterium TaxID=33986 RepID=A0ABY5FT31_9BACL|nr:hypothetical protein [Exiguobacterium aurantiacum]UTT44618.1 hypothetical protein NMQ00_16095 [Exiguobacterium aurantiacum]